MDLAKIVDYEFLHTLELKHPVSDKPLGIVFRIRSAESTAARKIMREQLDRVMDSRMRGKSLRSEQIEQDEIEKAASYIASWDWGKHTFGNETPTFSFDKAVEIMREMPWVFSQVVEAATTVGNFSAASE